MMPQLPSTKKVFKEKLAHGEILLGLIVGSPDPAITEIVGVSGFDFVILDSEHSPMGPETALNHVRAAEASGIVPFVRVGEVGQSTVQKFLDIGCQGLVFPRVESAEQAAEAVSLVQFAPRGRRGMCPSCHGAWYGAHEWEAYSEASEEEVLCIVLIESNQGVENARDIAAIDGVDVIFFGPGDLSQEYGDGPGWHSARTRDAWQVVRSATEGLGTFLMTAPHPEVDSEAVYRLVDDGAHMIVYSADWVLFRKTLAEISKLKNR
jgi:2-keto-3-deoxy-L-rhamnonate aldolase RhmA